MSVSLRIRESHFGAHSLIPAANVSHAEVLLKKAKRALHGVQLLAR